MEYTLACIWCYYYDDSLEVPVLVHTFPLLWKGLV